MSDMKLDQKIETIEKNVFASSNERLFATKTPIKNSVVDSMDPADRITFTNPTNEGILRFDMRSDDELKQVMFGHKNEMERERAVWEYGDRYKHSSLPLLKDVAKNDLTPSVRWSTLWVIQKFGGSDALHIISESLNDENLEVRDWASLFIREITGNEVPEFKDPRSAKYDVDNPFDQTLPLLISGYARVEVPSVGWVQATLSPKWFESIMGRVMACTKIDTFDKDLVIEKKISGYHPDGSDHYEIYKFKGFTFNPAPNVTEHTYESQSTHTFYPSGKVEDTSIDPVDDVKVILNRKATPVVVPPKMPTVPTRKGIKTKSSLKENPCQIVESVRGRFMGSAFINVHKLVKNKMKIGPGEVQLSSLHHPIVGAMTNTFLFGTFKGKLSDQNNDGYLDINTEPCHGTVDGKLDYNLQGSANPDPFDPFKKV